MLKYVEQRQNTQKHQNWNKMELNLNTTELKQMNLVEYIVLIAFRFVISSIYLCEEC